MKTFKRWKTTLAALAAGGFLLGSGSPAMASIQYGSVILPPWGTIEDGYSPISWSWTTATSRFDAAWLGAIGCQAEFDTPMFTYTSRWEFAEVVYPNDITSVDWFLGSGLYDDVGGYLVVAQHLWVTWPVQVEIMAYSNDWRMVNK